MNQQATQVVTNKRSVDIMLESRSIILSKGFDCKHNLRDARAYNVNTALHDWMLCLPMIQAKCRLCKSADALQCILMDVYLR